MILKKPFRHSVFMSLLLFVSISIPVYAQVPAIASVPQNLPASAALNNRHANLQKWHDELKAKTVAHKSKCTGVTEGTQLDEWCSQKQTRLEGEKAKYIAAVNKFNADVAAAAKSQSNVTPSTETVALTARVHALDRQIAEMEKQLRGLGFKKAVPDFTSLAGQSQKAQQHMVSQLISRVRDYATDQSEEAMSEHFLKYIGTMKEEKVKNLANFLQSKGADEPLFQEWLRSFSPDASRAKLVSGAQLAIDVVKGGEDLFTIREEMEKETVQGKQQAALTLISMVADYPGMKELTQVASGAYDVIEAGVTICILDRGIKDLTTATETQLANQKEIMLRMKALVDERKDAREKLARL
jgi:hypothetical protein